MKTIETFTERQLKDVVLPDRTKSYHPVSHGEILDNIYEQAAKNGLTISNTQYKVARGGNQVIGVMDVTSPSDNNEFGMRMAWRNSYDKTMSFGYAAGIQAFICSNGMISGEIQLRKKHVGSVEEEAKYIISEGFSQIGDIYQLMVDSANRLKEIEIDKKLNAELIGRMLLQEEFLNTMQVNVIKDQMYNSKHFTTILEPGYSAYDLYSHSNHSLKLSHPITYIQDHIKLHSFMMEEFA